MAGNEEDNFVRIEDLERVEDRVDQVTERVIPPPPESQEEAQQQLSDSLNALSQNTPGKRMAKTAGDTCSIFDTMPDLLDRPEQEADEEPDLDDLDEEDATQARLAYLKNKLQREREWREGWVQQLPGGEIHDPDISPRALGYVEFQVANIDRRIADLEREIAILELGEDAVPPLPDVPEPPLPGRDPIEEIEQEGEAAKRGVGRLAAEASKTDAALAPGLDSIRNIANRLAGAPQAVIERASGIIGNLTRRITQRSDKAFEDVDQPLEQASKVVQDGVEIQVVASCDASQEEIAAIIEQKANQFGLPVPEPGALVPPQLKMLLEQELGPTLTSAASAAGEGLLSAKPSFGPKGETLTSLGAGAATGVKEGAAKATANLPGLEADLQDLIDEGLIDLEELEQNGV